MKKLFMFLVLFAFPAYAATVNLAWDRHGDPNVAGYNVYRATTPGGPYTKLNLMLVPQTTIPTTPMYTDMTPTGSTLTYYYVVRAQTSGGVESGNSNEVAVNPPPTPPTNLRVVSFSAVNLLIDGNKVASGVPPLNFVLPRQTPPRLVPIAVTVAP
jgi:hypothetical protein